MSSSLRGWRTKSGRLKPKRRGSSGSSSAFCVVPAFLHSFPATPRFPKHGTRPAIGAIGAMAPGPRHRPAISPVELDEPTHTPSARRRPWIKREVAHAIAATPYTTQAHFKKSRRRGRRARHDGDSGTRRRRRVEGSRIRRARAHRRGRRRHLLDEVSGVQPALPVSSETGDPGSASTAESGGHAAFGHCRFRCGRDKGTGRSEAGPHLNASSTIESGRLRARHGGARRVSGHAATETKDEAEGRDQRAGRAARRAALVRFAGWGAGVI